ncbi:MAG: ABC transporter substrate-binding protein [Coriobacteriia bacterium]|nr:ABC transporter substrate-binding protein [Coriobacteriia bacterium]
MIRQFRFARLAVAGAAASLLLVAGCTSPAQPTQTNPEPPAAVPPIAIKIGTLPTEDSLPLWVAEDKGYIGEEGVPGFEIVVFQSAQERDVAFASGAIDGYMGDIIASANLEAAGTGVTLATVMLGADQSQGRFGIAAPKGWKGATGIEALTELAGVPVGTSSATIQEYVLDGLMAEAGVPADQVKVEEVKKVPVRYELLMSGKLKAAALPEPFLSLAESEGAVLVADDTTSKSNLSQTVLGISDTFMSEAGGTETVDALMRAWDRAVADINADPEAYRPLLVEQARLPKPLETTYQVNTYPTHTLPTKAEVDAVITWMKGKGYLESEVTYEDLTLVLPKN